MKKNESKNVTLAWGLKDKKTGAIKPEAMKSREFARIVKINDETVVRVEIRERKSK